MDDLLGEFLTETNEGLQVLDTELVKLEQDPSPELLDNIFRVMHTIKGTCGFLGLPRLEAVAHSGETVLGKIRDGELVVTPSRVSLILECLDRIREILGKLEETEAEPEGDDSELIGKLDAVSEMADHPDAPVPDDSPAAAPEPAAPEPVDELEEIFRNAPGPDDIPESAQLKDAEPHPAEAHAGAADATHAESPNAERPSAPGAEAVGAPAPAAQASEPKAAPEPKQAESKPADSKAAGKPPERETPRESQVASQSIRVSVDLLENLMTTVSELVLNRNQLLQILRSQQESEFSAPLQRLNHVVSELQEGVMKTRMQPIGNAWSKLPRIVRDLSQELDKKIELKMKGEDTELDRQVLELIKDPLTHMVRNSADHGIETTVDRANTGKPEVGTIALNAYHEGGHIIIEIGDDGRGLNVEKIKQKALKNQITTEAEVAQLTEQQIQQFIFKPGFSTADAVTAVSGRGVGMDVVRTNIEKIGGTIELSSKEGLGSKFTVKIPLTLAIVSALIVECAGERFAIPQLAVLELVRAKGGSENQIERIKDTPVLRLRDRLLPLVNLRELLRLQGHGNNAGSEDGADSDTDGFIVVAQVGTYSFGIIVDRVFDTEEIVVKPVARILRDIPLFSGNTILGDGRVVMILDPNGIASASGELTLVEGEDTLEDARKQRGESEEEVSMLVFNAAGKSPKAVPLALVARLEEIAVDTIEDSNGQRVVQYRGQLMPLITMPGGEIAESGNQPVLVFTDRDRSMGLVVDEIVDIVEERMNIELHGERAGYLGSAVIAGKATDIIDAGYYLTQAFSDWFEAESVRDAGEGDGKRVLLVDDSPFFRNLLAPLLDVAGYDVTTAESADAALELCNSGHEFDVIVSDIEMPGMNGYEFAAALREQGKWADTPLVALSSHAAPSDLERGRQAGFRDYVAKFDRETLLDSLNQTLGHGQEPLRGAA